MFIKSICGGMGSSGIMLWGSWCIVRMMIVKIVVIMRRSCIDVVVERMFV